MTWREPAGERPPSAEIEMAASRMRNTTRTPFLHIALILASITPTSCKLKGGLSRRRQQQHRRAGSGDESGTGSRAAIADVGTGVVRNEDTGARYRVRLLNTEPPRYLYQLDDAIVAHRAFFSLFRWQSTRDGHSHVLGDHAGRKWLSMLQLSSASSTGEMPRLGLSLSTTNRTAGRAQLLWPRSATHPSCTSDVELPYAECVVLHLDAIGAGGRALVLAKDAGNSAAASKKSPALRAAVSGRDIVSASQSSMIGANIVAGPAQEAIVFRLEPVMPPSSPSSTAATAPSSSFKDRVRRSVTRAQGRDFVLVTYHNVGMLDWARLFWRWLHISGLRRFMLLDLDGKTCAAAAALNCSLHVECATGHDMASILSPAYTVIRDASRMQEWGTDSESGYFKFLRWKLAIVELLLREGVDVLMADVDVLVLSRPFYEDLAASPYDLTISSDAREGRYNDNRHCPCSHPAYQRYAADWVCAGLFYMRSTAGALWFMSEVVALMDQFVITDQDAVQAILTGHTQVAVPQTRRAMNESGGRSSSATDDEATTGAPRVKSHAVMKGYRPSSAWLKPLWLEGLEPGETLRNTKGLQPLNTPMRPNMWERVSERRRASGFNWTTAPVEKFANGPMLMEHWQKTFSRSTGATAQKGGKAVRRRLERFASVHANCNVKQFLALEENSGSLLLHP